MEINYIDIIEEVKKEIKNKIEFEEKRLKDIDNAISSLASIVNYSEENKSKRSKETKKDIVSDVLLLKRKTLSSISSLHSQINSLQKSLAELEKIDDKNGGIKEVMKGIKEEIEKREKEIEEGNRMIEEIEKRLEILFKLQVRCPYCGDRETQPDASFFLNNSSLCPLCNGTKIATIGSLIRHKEGERDEEERG